jgi:rhodanese-related sulfurtransferase
VAVRRVVEGSATLKIVRREELRRKIERGDDFVLVDALSTQHYRSSHLPGAVNLPLEFVDEAESVLPDKRAEIIVYCMNSVCAASAEEVRELREMGYENIRHYTAGKHDWIEAGLPVEGKHASDMYRSTI